jgi:hypothetical protein
MKKLNCWDVMKCGREPGGARVEESGTCPASMETSLDGVNGGIAGGRACWGVPNTDCGGTVREKIPECLDCSFFLRVMDEEGSDFAVLGAITRRLKIAKRRRRRH